MQQQIQHLQTIKEYTIQGNHVELEGYLRDNKIGVGVNSFSQAFLECLNQIRDSEEHLQCVSLLLKQEIDFSMKDKFGNTALMLAIQCGNISVVKLLLEHKEWGKAQLKQGLDIAIDSNQDNWDIVEALLRWIEPEKPQHLIRSLRKGNIKTSSKLIEKGGAQGQDERGDTALHIASELELVDLVRQICRQEPSLLLKKNKGQKLAKEVSGLREDIRRVIEEEEMRSKSPQKKQQQQQQQFEEENQQQKKKSAYCQTEKKIMHQQEQQTETHKQDGHCQTGVEQVQIQQSFYQSLQCNQIERKVKYLEIIQQLTYEINTFGQEIQKYQNDQKPLIDKILQLMNESIKSMIPQARVTVYGSCSTQLFLLDSDIDLVIENPRNEDMVIQLYRLSEMFKYKSYVQEAKVIENARFPVLKLKCSQEYEYKMIDITIYNHLHNGTLSAKTLIEFQKEFKQLKYLALILKHYFKSINLLNSYQGGLNSYALMIMIIALLQIKRVEDNEDQPIGRTFIDFFQLYGFELDYYGKRINIIPPASMNYQYDAPNIFQDIFTQKGQEQQLYIVDLHNPENNVARTTFKIKQIKTALSLGYGAILNAKKCEQQCYFTLLNIPVCCIIKQVIQNSRSYVVDSQENNKQPYYYLFNNYMLQPYITQN